MNPQTCKDFLLRYVNCLCVSLSSPAKEEKDVSVKHLIARLLNAVKLSCKLQVSSTNSLIASCKLRLCPSKEVSDEVCLTAHVDVTFVGATTQSFIQGGTISFLFTWVQLSNQNVIRSHHLVLTICAKPVKNKIRLVVLLLYSKQRGKKLWKQHSTYVFADTSQVFLRGKRCQWGPPRPCTPVT